MDPISIGLAAGGLGLTAAGMMRKQPNYGYSKGDLEALAARRSGEINDFALQLSGLRQRYASQLTNFGNNTFNRFAPQAEASFGARGLQVTGGAFQSALARRASEIQDEQGQALLGLEHSDINAVDSARAGLFSGQAGFNPSGPSADPMAQAMGGLGSGIFSLGMSGAMTPSGSGRASTYGGEPGFRSALAKRSVFSNNYGQGNSAYSKTNLGWGR